MEVQLNAEMRPVNPQRDTVRPKAVAAPGQEVSFLQSAMLDDALAGLPGVRPEAVARGQALAGSTDYPPLEIMQKIACLLAVSTKQPE